MQVVHPSRRSPSDDDPRLFGSQPDQAGRLGAGPLQGAAAEPAVGTPEDGYRQRNMRTHGPWAKSWEWSLNSTCWSCVGRSNVLLKGFERSALEPELFNVTLYIYKVSIEFFEDSLFSYYTGQTKVVLLETQTHVYPYPLESYIEIPGAVWAVIFHTGKTFIDIYKRL